MHWRALTRAARVLPVVSLLIAGSVRAEHEMPAYLAEKAQPSAAFTDSSAWARCRLIDSLAADGLVSKVRDIVGDWSCRLPDTPSGRADELKLRVKIVEAMLAAGDIDGAEKLASSLLAAAIELGSCPGAWAVRSKLGFDFYQARRPGRAIAILEPLVHRDWKDDSQWRDWTRLCLATAYLDAGLLDECYRETEALVRDYLVEGNEQTGTAYYGSAGHPVSQRYLEVSCDALTDRIVGTPYACDVVLVRAFLLLGDVAVALGRSDDAVMAYRQTVSAYMSCACPLIEPVLTEATHKLSLAYKAVGRTALADEWERVSQARHVVLRGVDDGVSGALRVAKRRPVGRTER